MGDTGSMCIGFLIAFFTVRFIGHSQTNITSVFHGSAPLLAVSILFFPLLDTLRIFFIRLVIHRKSPFEADQNHLHHRYLQIGFAHYQTTLCIVITNLVLIVSAFLIGPFNIHIQFVILLAVGFILYSIFFIWNWIVSNHSFSSVFKQLN